MLNHWPYQAAQIFGTHANSWIVFVVRHQLEYRLPLRVEAAPRQPPPVAPERQGQRPRHRPRQTRATRCRQPTRAKRPSGGTSSQVARGGYLPSLTQFDQDCPHTHRFACPCRPTTTLEQAHVRISWYARRWDIEVYHRTLKSGCRIEDRQFGTASRLEACLAIDLVVAWRVMLRNRQCRETPDAPCSVHFRPEEWKALWIRTGSGAMPSDDEVPTLREAVRRVASLGGFLGRKSDGEPGTQTRKDCNASTISPDCTRKC